MSIADIELEEIKVKSNAFDYLLCDETVRDVAERALEVAMHAEVNSIPTYPS